VRSDGERRTFLAEQELSLFDREEALARLSDRLASMIGTRAEGIEPRFLPADDPPGRFPVEPIEIVVRTALEENKELRAAREDVEAARAASRAALWEALPSVDLTGSLRGRGLAGEPQDVFFLGQLRSGGGGGWACGPAGGGARLSGWTVGVGHDPIGFREDLGEKKRLDAGCSGRQREVEEARRGSGARAHCSSRAPTASGRRRAAWSEEQVRIRPSNSTTAGRRRSRWFGFPKIWLRLGDARMPRAGGQGRRSFAVDSRTLQ
jgi:hypothetical protein